MINKIYLDLDGVMANFNLQLDIYMEKFNFSHCKQPNETWQDFENRTNTSVFSMLSSKISAAGMLEFWATIPKYSWSDNMITTLKDYKTVALTAVPRHKMFTTECQYGKEYWCAKNYPWLEVNIVLREHKKNHAFMDTLIIDDYEKNVNEFIKAGGQGILFESYSKFLDDFEHIKALNA